MTRDTGKKGRSRRNTLLSSYISVVPLEEAETFGISLPDGRGELRTPAGNPVCSENYRLLLHMVRELEQYPVLTVEDGIVLEPRPLSAYLVYSTQRDFVESDAVLERCRVAEWLEEDPILHPSGGPEWTDQLRAWEPVDEFLRTLGAELHPRPAYSDDTWQGLVDAVWTRWKRLSHSGQAVVLNLCPMTAGNLIASVALASGACSDIEFAHAVLATSPLHHTFGLPSNEMTPEEQHTNAFKECRELGRVCADYLSFFPAEGVAHIVASGESTTVEFKSTLRWDLHQNKKNDAVTHGVLKTVAAFLNTEGGRLLIGVGNDGQAVGIELDDFPDDDRFLLHLFSVIKASMGKDAATLVQADIDFFQGKKVCNVRCRKSQRPVYVKAGGKDEEFFIRTGPSTDRLGPSELVTYVTRRFKA